MPLIPELLANGGQGILPQDLLLLFLASVGIVTFSSWLWDFFFKGVYGRLFRPDIDVVKKYGRWAVVTGATDGIGKAMAFELGRKNCNVIFIARNKEKLEHCAKEFSTRFPNQDVKVLEVDYSNFDAAARKRVQDLVNELDVGVLVNNVGVSYPFTKFFHELDDERVEHLITLNVNSTTWMTRIVLPGMLARKRGAIVNISSVGGTLTSPLLSQYGAAKSYVVMFSKALHAEYKSAGIHVQCQIPLYVATKLAKIKSASLFVASPSDYARAAISAIGYEVVVSPYWSHALQLWFLAHLPQWLLVEIVRKLHLGIRKAGLKKEQKKSSAEADKDKTS